MTTTVAGARVLDPEFLRRLEHLALVARRVQVGTVKGERKSKRKGSSVEFADYRDYVQGDDLRHVDWNIASRLGTLNLKLFQEQEDLTLHVLIDASASMTFGSPPKIDVACRLAAALGYIALVGYDRLSVEAFSGENAYRLRPCRGKASVQKLFAFMEGVRADGTTQLEASCRSYANRNRAKGVAVLISDLLDPAGFDGCLRRLSQSGSDLYVIHLLSREELDPPISGDLCLIDSETQTATEISVSRALLKRYREHLTGFLKSARHACVRRNITYTPAANDEPFERVILDMLRRGGMVR